MIEDVKVSVDGAVVSCCGWCFPGTSIFSKYPALSGKKISHGICKCHLALQLRELEAMQQVINK